MIVQGVRPLLPAVAAPLEPLALPLPVPACFADEVSAFVVVLFFTAWLLVALIPPIRHSAKAGPKIQESNGKCWGCPGEGRDAGLHRPGSEVHIALEPKMATERANHFLLDKEFNYWTGYPIIEQKINDWTKN